MRPKTELRVHLAAYAIILVMGILIFSAFFPPMLMTLFFVPRLLRQRRAKFVPQQPMPAALNEAMRWSAGRW